MNFKNKSPFRFATPKINCQIYYRVYGVPAYTYILYPYSLSTLTNRKKTFIENECKKIRKFYAEKTSVLLFMVIYRRF